MLHRVVSRLISSKNGNVAVIAAIAAAPLAATAGAAIDLQRASSLHAQLQDSADAAALAGARALASGSSIENAKTTALNYASSATASAPVSATVTNNSTGQIGVSLSAQSQNLVLGLVGMPTTNVSATCSAHYSMGLPTCVMALNGAASPALSGTGNAGLQATACSVFVNSSAANALTLTGNASVAASQICVHGGVSATKPGEVAPAAQDCGIRPDPFAGMPLSTPAGCDFNNYSVKGAVTLSPGVYCGGLSLTAHANATLSPGVYVIRDGALSLTGGASMAGQGVTFVLEGNSSVDLTGGSQVQLAGPTGGPLQGFVFFQRPDANAGATARLTGGANMAYDGVLYFPTQTVELTGNGSASAVSCAAVVADKVRLTGNAAVAIGCNNPLVPLPPAIFGAPVISLG